MMVRWECKRKSCGFRTQQPAAVLAVYHQTDDGTEHECRRVKGEQE